jgi:hypothetical protein
MTSVPWWLRLHLHHHRQMPIQNRSHFALAVRSAEHVHGHSVHDALGEENHPGMHRGNPVAHRMVHQHRLSPQAQVLQ